MRLNEHLEAEGPLVLEHACRMGEGIVSIRALGAKESWLLDPKAEPPLDRTARTSPALLLQAKHRIVPFVDLDNRRQGLIDWVLGRGSYQPQAVAGRVIYGPGGLGKTRLLIELIQDLTEEGWLAGFVNYDVLGHPVRGPQFENLVRDGREAQGLLLVVDYAEGRAEEVKALARLIMERERAGRAPARLVLLSRAAGDWWRDLSGRNPDVALLFGIGEETMDTMRLADIASGEARLKLWKDFAAILKAHLAQAGYDEVKTRDPDAAPDAALSARLQRLQQDRDYARPLAIQIDAMLWLRGALPGAGERGIPPMLDRMVYLERAHWAEVVEGVNEVALDRGVAQVTAVQGVAGRERAIALLQADTYFGARSTDAATAIARELAKLYGEQVSSAVQATERPITLPSERIAALEPDLIGEHHVGMVGDTELIEGCLRWIESERVETQGKRRRDLLTVIQRATQPEHGPAAERASALLDYLVCNNRASANEMVDVMVGTPGKLACVLGQRVGQMDEESLAAIDAALPLHSLTLMAFSMRVAARRVDLARQLLGVPSAVAKNSSRARSTLLSDLAARLNTLGIRASHLGRREEALAATQEAVDIRRRLAQTRPDAFLPNLASEPE